MDNEIKKIGKNGALAILSQIPVVSAFSKFVEDFVRDNWQERIDLWKKEVVKRLAQLDTEMEQKIRDTSNFASILASAQRGALEDIEKDKVSLYANAAINSIKNENINNVKKHIFLNILRDLTNKHLRMLYYLQNPVKNAELPDRTKGYAERTLDADLIARSPWLSDDKELLNQIMKDLYNNGLSQLEGIRFGKIRYNCSQYAQKYTTKLGDEFLAFITEQETKNT